MSLFRNRNRPRACLDVRVGDSHILEVLVQIRRADWGWYVSNEGAVTEEFLELLEGSVISRMFGNEIEAYHREKNPDMFPPDADATVGSKNKKTAKKKGGGASAKGHGRANHQQHSAATKSTANGKTGDQGKDDDKMMEKDVYFSFGETVQLAYRWQPLAAGNVRGFAPSHKTILFQQEGRGSTVLGFRDYPKLSHRLIVWISRVTSPDQKTNPDPIGFGFVRPEMIPVSGLFRKPKELLEDDDDDDDRKK